MIEQRLQAETEKWLERAKQERRKINADDKNVDFLKNIDAYMKDAEHFMKSDDLIRAFEAVIWAWSWLEIGKELGIFRKTD